MKKHLAILLLIMVCTIFACDKMDNVKPRVIPPSAKPVYVQDLDALIDSLYGASPNLDNADLETLSFLGSSKIVGLGEATHGSKEFFQLKHRIFKYLVENYNFKVFAFECDMGESVFIDRYICGGEGDIADIMRNTMHFWTWKTEEVKELLEWMRSYNQGKAENEKIHYIGFDCQFLTYQPDLILDYFTNVKPEFLSAIEPTLNKIKEINNSATVTVEEYYTAMDSTEMKSINDSLDLIYDKIEDIESELISKSSNYEYQFIKQLIVNIGQVNINNYSTIHYDVTFFTYRDKFMADNALWISNLFGVDSKISVWAHNMHVANDEYYFRHGSSMGYYLRSELNNQYQVVGFGLSKGSFTAVDVRDPENVQLTDVTIGDPDENSTNHIFSQAKYENFILKTADVLATNSELKNMLNVPIGFLSIGATYTTGNHNYRPINLLDQYDVIIYYKSTSASTILW